MDDASPEMLESMEVAPNIHDGLTRYMITPDGGKLRMGQGYAADPQQLFYSCTVQLGLGPLCPLTSVTIIGISESACKD